MKNKKHAKFVRTIKRANTRRGHKKERNTNNRKEKNWNNYLNWLLTFFSLFCPDFAVDGLSDFALSGFLPIFPVTLVVLSSNAERKKVILKTLNTSATARVVWSCCVIVILRYVLRIPLVGDCYWRQFNSPSGSHHQIQYNSIFSPSITFAKWLIYSWVSWAIRNYTGSTLFCSMIGPLNPCHSSYQSDLNLNQLHLCHLRFPTLQVIYFVFTLSSPYLLVTFYFILFVFVTKSGFIHCHPVQKRNSEGEIWMYFSKRRTSSLVFHYPQRHVLATLHTWTFSRVHTMIMEL